ncbi:acetyltransferase [Marinobacter zhanjiangensis]|uniref:Carbonic anhydrase n=1 Tax=Marinobacter zhanjiangensis TaxID=578215 RepID=A0ABQ3B4D0_9GAMM|nr:acetyltransferase [Marinobacter zhanjiangensis]GGY76431.1 carbonic anhydrase [Marinobacter zhanjiangensis]
MTTRAVTDLRAKDCILIGAGGHARVVQDLAELCGATILGVCDPKFQGKSGQLWHGLKVLGDDEYLSGVNPEEVLLLNGIGMLPGDRVRKVVFQRLTGMGFCFPALVHPFAWLSHHASIGDGAQVMAGAVVQAGASIGINTIVNTRSSVDHDSRVGDHCHLAPGATLCGNVRIGEGSFIGAGATITQVVTVAPETFIKAGSLTTSGVL